MKSYSFTRDITVMAMAVACNTALELTLGTFLHAVKFPLTGSLMVVVNACAYLLAYQYNPRFGRITVMGIASAVVQLLMAGGLKFMVLPALITEALAIDVIISALGVSRLSFVICGACAGLTAFVCKLFNMYVFRGIPLDAALQKTADIGVHWDSLGAVITAMTAYRLGVGALFAWFFWPWLVRLSAALSLSAPPAAVPYASCELAGPTSDNIQLADSVSAETTPR